MTQSVTLELPSDLVARAGEVAARTQRPVEDVLIEWLNRNGTETVENLSDADVLSLCDTQMPDREQQQLSELLARQREGEAPANEKQRLQELLQECRRGLIIKARVWQAAVARGLRPPLG
jgi:hypothetical protein